MNGLADWQPTSNVDIREYGEIQGTGGNKGKGKGMKVAAGSIRDSLFPLFPPVR
jgi:hypothetical protein